MLKGRQAIMRLKTYKKEVAHSKHAKAEIKQTRIQGLWITTPCMLEQVCVCMNSICVCRLDQVYTDPSLKNLKSQKQSRNQTKENVNLAI